MPSLFEDPAEVIEIQDEDEPALPRRRGGGDTEVDITPMIDIVFLLLIFFLVTSTPDQQTAIDLADAQNGVQVPQLSSTIFTIAAGGFDNAPVYEADGRIEAHRLSEDPDKRIEEIKAAVEKGMLENKTDVIIKADKRVKCRETNRVIKAVSKVEGVKINLAILTQ